MISYTLKTKTKRTQARAKTLERVEIAEDSGQGYYYSSDYEIGDVGSGTLTAEIKSITATDTTGGFTLTAVTSIANGKYYASFQYRSVIRDDTVSVSFTTVETYFAEIANCQEPLMASERLDRELDSGSGNFVEVAQGTGKLLPTLKDYKLTLTDGTSTKDLLFIGKDERARISNGTTTIDRHTLSLTECAKLLQGETLDGFKVVQPTSGTQKTIYDVLTRLLAVTPLRKSGQSQKYSLANTSELTALYNNTVSPQFAWNTQTTLWEALCDIGDTINAIPKLLPDSNGNYNQISYTLINKQTAVVTDLIDDYTIGYVERVDETQYNTQLVTMANNLIEE